MNGETVFTVVLSASVGAVVSLLLKCVERACAHGKMIPAVAPIPRKGNKRDMRNLQVTVATATLAISVIRCIPTEHRPPGGAWVEEYRGPVLAEAGGTRRFALFVAKGDREPSWPRRTDSVVR